MPRQQDKQGGSYFNAATTSVADQARITLTGNEDTLSVDPVTITASHASVASAASVASTASAGTLASVASVASRASAASVASAGTLASAASYGTIASIASVAYRASIASAASQGTAAGFSRGSRASQGSIASIAGPVFVSLPAMADAENIAILKKGASGEVDVSASDSATLNGIARRTLDTEHEVNFMIPNGTDWTVKD